MLCHPKVQNVHCGLWHISYSAVVNGPSDILFRDSVLFVLNQRQSFTPEELKMPTQQGGHLRRALPVIAGNTSSFLQMDISVTHKDDHCF